MVGMNVNLSRNEQDMVALEENLRKTVMQLHEMTLNLNRERMPEPVPMEINVERPDMPEAPLIGASEKMPTPDFVALIPTVDKIIDDMVQIDREAGLPDMNMNEVISDLRKMRQEFIETDFNTERERMPEMIGLVQSPREEGPEMVRIVEGTREPAPEMVDIDENVELAGRPEMVRLEEPEEVSPMNLIQQDMETTKESMLMVGQEPSDVSISLRQVEMSETETGEMNLIRQDMTTETGDMNFVQIEETEHENNVEMVAMDMDTEVEHQPMQQQDMESDVPQRPEMTRLEETDDEPHGDMTEVEESDKEPYEITNVRPEGRSPEKTPEMDYVEQPEKHESVINDSRIEDDSKEIHEDIDSRKDDVRDNRAD